MEVIELIITIGALVAAITGIAVFITKLVKWGRKVYAFFHDLSANVKMLVKHDNEQYMALLRLTITADHVPVSERLIAGKEYVERGGNGDIKRIYNELREQCEHAIEE